MPSSSVQFLIKYNECAKVKSSNPSIMSFQIVDILKRRRREHLHHLAIDSREKMPICAKLSFLAVPDRKLSHHFKIIYQYDHKTQLI